MAATIHDWVDSGQWPADFYELLGLCRFDPDRPRALAAIKSSYAELMQRENEQDKQKADRAIRLQRELAKANEVFCDPKKLASYNAHLISQLREDYLRLGGSGWTASQLRLWLQQEQHVHPDWLNVVIQQLSLSGIDTSELELSDTTIQPDTLNGQDVGPRRASPFPGSAARPRVFAADRAPRVPRPAERVVEGALAEPAATETVQPVTLELERRELPWKAIMIGGGMVIALLVVLNVILLLRRFAPPGDRRQPPQRVQTAAPPRPTPAPTPTSQPAPTPTSEPAPSAPGRPSPPEQPDPFAVGTNGIWTGELQWIRGHSDDRWELHFRVQLETPIDDVTVLDAFAQDEAFAREVLDYVTSEELSEQNASDAETTAGDRIRLRGTVTDEDVVMRVPPRDAPLVRLQWIEVVGRPGSKAVVGGPPRPASSFHRPPEDCTLKGILRLPPRTGDQLTFTGIYRRYDPDSEMVLVALGPAAERGALVLFRNADFARYRAGDRVQVVATGTPLRYRRVVNHEVIKNPILIGKTIKRPDVVGDEPIRNDAAAE